MKSTSDNVVATIIIFIVSWVFCILHFNGFLMINRYNFEVQIDGIAFIMIIPAIIIAILCFILWSLAKMSWKDDKEVNPNEYIDKLPKE